MHEKPLLLIDVDRALSPIRKPDVPGETWICSRIFGFEMPFHPELRSWMGSLAETYDFVWCSTWEEDGLAELSVHLAMPEDMRVIPIGSDSPVQPGEDEKTETAKLFYVDHWLRASGLERRPLAWLDDRLEADAFAWASARSAPTLLVRTDPIFGITAADVQLLLRFALDRRPAKELA